MHRHFHFHAAMVFSAMGLAIGTMSAVTLTQPSRAATPLPFFSVSAVDSPQAAIILDSQPDVHVAHFTFRGGREDMTIHTLTLHNCVATPKDSDGDCIDGTEALGSDLVAPLVTLTATSSNGNTQVVTGVFVDGSLTFSDLSLLVAHSLTATVDVNISTAAIDDTAVTSGMQFQVAINARTKEFSATLFSGRVITQTDVNKNYAANGMTLRNTKPTLTLSTLSPMGYVEPSFLEVLRVDATAEAAGDITFNSVVFSLTTTDNAGTVWNTCKTLGADTSNFKLVNTLTNTEVPATWVAYRANGNACTPNRDDVAFLSATLTTAETIPAGTTTPYALHVQTVRASALQSDSMSAALPSETELSALGMDVNALVWSDGTSGGTEIDGTIIEILPVIGNTLIFHKSSTNDQS